MQAVLIPVDGDEGKESAELQRHYDLIDYRRIYVRVGAELPSASSKA